MVSLPTLHVDWVQALMSVVVEPTSRSPNQVKKTSTTLVASTPGKPKRLQDKFALVKEIIESLEKETMAAIGPDSVDTSKSIIIWYVYSLTA